MIVTFGNFTAFFLAALALIVREMYHYPKARRFLLRTLSITSIFTVLGGAEIEALNVLHSRFAGIKAFDAPISQTTKNYIFWLSVIGVFTKDIPKFAIQVSNILSF